MFMDTERENRINLGKDWPYETLNEGECLASTYFEKEYHVSKGETVYFNYTVKNSFYNIRAFYNERAREEGWEEMDPVPDGWKILTPCKIVDFFDKDNPHGKVPKDMAEDLIIMEQKHYMSWWSKNLPEFCADNTDLINYMQTEGISD